MKEILKLLSSKEEQTQYEKNVPIANVPAELQCMWFDDIYHPNTRLFDRSFNSDEKEKLEEFNQFYEMHRKKLPNTLAEMHMDENWKAIMNKAKEILKEIT